MARMPQALADVPQRIRAIRLDPRSWHAEAHPKCGIFGGPPPGPGERLTLCGQDGIVLAAWSGQAGGAGWMEVHSPADGADEPARHVGCTSLCGAGLRTGPPGEGPSRKTMRTRRRVTDTFAIRGATTDLRAGDPVTGARRKGSRAAGDPGIGDARAASVARPRAAVGSQAGGPADRSVRVTRGWATC